MTRNGQTTTWGNWDRLVTASNLNNYLALSGGKLTGALSLASSLYGSDFGLNANNSDIVNVNGIRLADKTDQ